MELSEGTDTGEIRTGTSKIIRGHVGDTFRVRLEVRENGHGEKLAGLCSTIVLAKRVGGQYEVLNDRPLDLPVSGELTNYVPELAAGSECTQEIELLFVSRNTYRVGAVCDFEGSQNFYVCGQAITFEII